MERTVRANFQKRVNNGVKKKKKDNRAREPAEKEIEQIKTQNKRKSKNKV